MKSWRNEELCNMYELELVQKLANHLSKQEHNNHMQFSVVDVCPLQVDSHCYSMVFWFARNILQ